jgi:hypothetical protein
MADRKKLNILFVGFIEVGTLLREELFEHGEHNVDIDTSPEAGKARLVRNNHGYDLLITGNRINGVDDAGMDLVGWTKENSPETKVVLSSVYSDNKDGAYLAGADGFWNTSSDLTGLLDLIDKLFPDYYS